ncbi:MAG TPA: cytochrome c biogenesis protein CcsA [Fimbriimonadaceae bacterium]|nr:cytochrome c biogenesis protein CcsA [Fimbriimonadaceae bacterium]HRJ97326.1 cytochrome c biogenesis protein CcsA [Fimbriimonadaceae bacterium]
MDDLSLPRLVSPPEWSLLVGETGRFLVFAAVVAFLISILAWLFTPKSAGLSRVGRWSFVTACAALFGTFVSLAILFIGNRFEYSYVSGHADSHNTVPYRIAGIWSGQEGSFLLWAVCAAIFGLIVRRKLGHYERWFTVAYATFLGGLAAILAYESPFVLNLVDGKPFVPADGVGLAPALQNYWVTIHPPTIFLGFGSLTALFALALAAMLTRDYEGWIPIVRPWAIVSATLVGLGLCMGGFWAYETLGWGGFWMWDPVENVSFVPWVFTAAFIHGIIVQSTRGRWQISNLLLAGLPFLAFLFGTFLTRSGFLADASVHSFAEMNRSALRLLVGVIGILSIGFAVSWFTRMIQNRKRAEPEAEGPGVDREGFYRTGILFLIAMGLATLIGMSVPLIMALQGKQPAVVEERVYHMVLPYLFIPLMLVMAIAPFVSWRRMKSIDLARRIYSVFCITIGLLGFLLLAFAMTPMGKIADISSSIAFPGGFEVRGLAWVFFLVGLCVFAAVGNVWRIFELRRASKLSFGPFVTHMGVAVLMAGLIVSRGFERKARTFVMEDHPGRGLSYVFRYAGQTSDRHDRNNKVRFEVLDPHQSGKILFTATPGLYYVHGADGGENPMVWPSIHRFAFHDVYLTLEPPQTETGAQTSLLPGDSKPLGGLSVEYMGMTREGSPGTVGAKFGARLKVSSGGESAEVVPNLELAADGPPISNPANLDGSLQIALLGMDVATQSVTVGLQLSSPMYPIEVYHKPLTSLVWLGTGMMTLGGFVSAFYRRRPRKRDMTSVMAESNTLRDTEKVPVAT